MTEQPVTVIDLSEEDLQDAHYFQIVGDSMAPELTDGAMVMGVGRKRHTWAAGPTPVIVCLDEEPEQLLLGRLERVTQYALTLVPDNVAHPKRIIGRTRVKAVYEIMP